MVQLQTNLGSFGDVAADGDESVPGFGHTNLENSQERRCTGSEEDASSCFDSTRISGELYTEGKMKEASHQASCD